MTDAEASRLRKRRGHWLRLARVTAGIKQVDAAHRLGLAAGTTILAWEKGRRDPDATQMLELANMYGVPVSLFADPDETDEERVISRRAALAREAIGLAHEDLAQAEGARRAGAARRASPPRRRSA